MRDRERARVRYDGDEREKIITTKNDKRKRERKRDDRVDGDERDWREKLINKKKKTNKECGDKRRGL
jgi:hypothetical protein